MYIRLHRMNYKELTITPYFRAFLNIVCFRAKYRNVSQNSAFWSINGVQNGVRFLKNGVLKKTI